MLSYNDAKQFLEKILQIEDFETKFRENKLELLRDILRRYIHAEPFQGISIMSTKPEDRHLLTFEEIKQDMFARRGGLCYANNRFINVLLNTIGYDVYHIGCTVLNNHNNHLSNIARDLTKPGDLHLVDAGMAFPSWDPIPLDFEDESPVYHVGFLYFKFVRKDNTILRLHKHDKQYEFPINIDSKAWHQFWEMTTEPLAIESFHPKMTDIYTIPGAHEVPFLEHLTCVAFAEDKLIAIKDSTFLFENNDHQLEVRDINTRAELVSTFSAYFPQFPMDIFEAAIDVAVSKI
ncbi:arylamine N-acetyltransferase 1-like [Anneissia japonica]|uniref:arylamine N-acetyltransferase 1-like n=1 Tax=Anneissia japonica TaxID=1529436 RepID=UPI00142588B7|nr:arylamine N-acetyltransferase 1-like [Anneissia japonica]XP_033121589.1 arylamine N-acetyltransferase 1-like [Anneissia japonica]XP_033121590.1 arylamine N-acetyltransferase 1-like [Anneissia japonica]XP_033121591.1 arylamine N-acetyltransferase 1-like [Anneissia japonica]XP_033121592.1 arylamine N-acetyltransferase 1-like [Anneissia japonica]